MIDALNTYMESLATTVLGHDPADASKRRYFLLSLEEILSSLALKVRTKGTWIMVQEATEMQMPVKSESQNPMVYQMAWMIVSHASAGDYTAQRVVQERAFELGMEVVKLMQQHFHNRFYPDAVAGFFDDFDFGSIKAHKVGPLMDHLHGYRFLCDGVYKLRDIRPVPANYQD